jgi:hypothetical protein
LFIASPITAARVAQPLDPAIVIYRRPHRFVQSLALCVAIATAAPSLAGDKKKPFVEIGDLARAKMHNDSEALWIVQRPNGSSYRLVAKGPAEHAVTIYMYSLQAEEVD